MRAPARFSATASRRFAPSSLIGKKIPVFDHPKSNLQPRRPGPKEGRIAIVTYVGLGCGGRGSVGRVIAIAGRFYVSDRVARGRTALQRLRQDFGRLHAGGLGIGGGCCVRQSRVVLAPVAGVKLVEAVRTQPGFDQPLIRWRR
jgi:hypothetical protein